MVYYKDGEILVRDMVQGDAQIITCEEIAQGWNQTIEKYEMRLQHQASGRSVALVAEYKGNVAGYVNVYQDSGNGLLQVRGTLKLWILVFLKNIETMVLEAG